MGIDLVLLVAIYAVLSFDGCSSYALLGIDICRLISYELYNLVCVAGM